MDLFSLSQATDPQARPDGGAIAYVRRTYDIMTDRAHPAIWLVDPATGAQTPLGSEPGGPDATSPRWSPDGKRLAFVAVREGERPQLYVRWMDTGQVAKVATLPEAPQSLAWSPDGKTLAFAAFVPSDPPTLGAPLPKPEGAKWAEPLKVITALTYRDDDAGYLRPGHTHLFTAPADGGAPRQVTFGDIDDGSDIAWTPDGRSLLFSANRRPDWARTPDLSQVYKVSLADGALTRLTDPAIARGGAQASPDGKLLAWIGQEVRHRGYENAILYVANADGSNERALTQGLDRSVSQLRWSGDSRALFVQYEDHGVNKVARVGLDGKTTPVAEGLGGGELDRPYAGGGFTVSRGGLVAFTQGAPDQPGDVAAATAGGPTRRLTRLNEALFQAKALGHVTPITVASSVDKRPIEAWVITPPGFDASRKYPLILEIHGGPFAAYGPQFASELQLYASAGYVVVYCNPRGSTSYGFDFADQINDDYPSHDYDDLMSVVDAVIAKGWADPNNLFVTGGSGGGVLTAWIVGKTDRFKAAVTQKPVIDWTSEVLTTDGYVGMEQDWFAKAPWEDYESYWRHSPLSLVGNVKTPTLVMVGEEDHRTPPGEAEQYYQALQLRGVPTGLVRVPGASHGGLAERPSQEAAEAAAILAWFERYRSGASKP
jgi:dipeptidyl aminopeptidase/acylaminoacyl peptidase